MASEPDFYDDEIIDYRYYIDLLRTVLLKNYKSIAVFCMVCVIGSVLYVQSQAPVYVSTVTLHIAPNDLTMFSFEQWMFSDDEKFQDTQIGILQSKKLMRRVVAKLELHRAGKLTPASFDAGFASKLKTWLSHFSEPALPASGSDDDQISDTASELTGLISISKPPSREYSNLLNVTVRMADPTLAAVTANTIAEEYIALVFENEINNAQKNQQFLSDRLSILREDLQVAEQTLQAYREAENIVTRSSGLDEVDEELSSLSNRYFEARENRLRRENLYQQLQDVRAEGRAWEKLAVISNHPRVTIIQSQLLELKRRQGELSKRYGSRHNKMIALASEIDSAERQLTNEVRDIIAGIKNEYELAVKLERAAETTLNGVRNRKQQLGRKEFKLNELVQAVESKREVYSIFLERLNQDGASGAVRNDNLWVADPAIAPKNGQRTPLSRAGIIALIMSFGLSMALGLVMELASNTITSGEDVEKKLGMPLLGYLPLIPGSNGKPGSTYHEYLNNPESRFSEALRTIRTSITLSTLNNTVGTNRYLVAASQSAEGKTSVALSLAAAFGQTSRVLIIDGDLRRPSIERILNTSNHKFPGLSDVIAHAVTIDNAIQRYEKEHIDVMYAGSRTVKPLELLASNQFTELMNELNDRYETIIIDSPPCVSVSDAYVLATQVDSIIFVTKSGEVPIPIVRNCLNRFKSMDAEIAGVLVNQIDFDAVHNYGRYQEYYDYRGYDETPTETLHETRAMKS